MAAKLALVSVTDKTGIADFCRKLVALGFEILSTGGTSALLQKEGVPVTPVESYTNSPEVMDGRVKTLHPRVHGGLLARAEKDLDKLTHQYEAEVEAARIKKVEELLEI